MERANGESANQARAVPLELIGCWNERRIAGHHSAHEITGVSNRSSRRHELPRGSYLSICHPDSRHIRELVGYVGSGEAFAWADRSPSDISMVGSRIECALRMCCGVIAPQKHILRIERGRADVDIVQRHFHESDNAVGSASGNMRIGHRAQESLAGAGWIRNHGDGRHPHCILRRMKGAVILAAT